jgi:hypothetical protein
MMKYILLLTIIFSVGCGQSGRLVDTTPVWVEITEEINEEEDIYYYGWISRNDYENLLSKEKINEMIRIRDIHWYNDGGLVLGENESEIGEMVMRTTDIIKISVLKDRDINELRKREKADQEKKKTKSESVVP